MGDHPNNARKISNYFGQWNNPWLVMALAKFVVFVDATTIMAAAEYKISRGGRNGTTRVETGCQRGRYHEALRKKLALYQASHLWRSGE